MTPMSADELKAAFAALPPMEPVKPAHSWAFWAWDLRQNVGSYDLSEFLTWPVVVATMFVGNAPYIDYEFDHLPWEFNTPSILEEPGIGEPPLYDAMGMGAAGCMSSGNLIHQAYHISHFDGWLPEVDTIIEVGGGYGAMCLICHRLGFRGRYIILDLPEFSILQQYYLSNVGVEGVEFRTQIDKQIETDLLIGLYSLSEMPLGARGGIIDLCPAKSYLLAYMANWGGYDNAKWAMEMMQRKGFIWRNWNNEHSPNTWYLAGDKR